LPFHCNSTISGSSVSSASGTAGGAEGTGSGTTSPTVGVHETGRTFHMDFIPDEGSLITSYTINGNTTPYGGEPGTSFGLDLAPVDGDSLISVLFDSIPLGPF
jgi:hypothetical protein